MLACGSCLVSCWVFFFKQKTAYEMRISDWSSDVCSSDLEFAVPNGESDRTGNRSSPLTNKIRWARTCAAAHRHRRECEGDLSTLGGSGFPASAEIGRASCRERVCQYV